MPDHFPEPVPMSPGELWLDPVNPRLAGHHFNLADQDEILEWLWREKSVDELVDSILASGYWDHEELFATKEDDKMVVVEGNRRLAAVKVILEPDICDRLGFTLPTDPTEDVLETLETLPVIVATRDQLWEFVGFKHVNGPQTWDSIAKAEYIYNVHTKFGVPIEAITKTIGDRHDTVVRLFRGYLVLKQARDSFGFDPDDAQNPRFPFSHLTTALGYKSIQDYLGVDSDMLSDEAPIPEDKIESLRDIMLWLYGSRDEDIDPKVKRQNPDLRHLANALEDKEGIEILKAGLGLSTAVEASRGDDVLFSESLTKSKFKLREAKRFVATGYDGNEDQLEHSRDIFSIAKSLHEEMESMHKRSLDEEESSSSE